MRLDKLIEKELQTTRKEMKRLFTMKKVKIDGVIEFQENRNVDSLLHEIEVAGERLQTNEVYYLLNKPSGVVTAVNDSNRVTVIDLIASADQQPALYPVGRLDRDTTGLLLLTTNGQLGYELLLPDKKVEKTYQVTVNAQLGEEDVQAFASGIIFADGTKCQPARLTISYANSKESQALLTIQEGKFHQVKKMFLAQGKKVNALTRTSMGPLTLDQQLAPGAYRALTLTELRQLSDYFK